MFFCDEKVVMESTMLDSSSSTAQRRRAWRRCKIHVGHFRNMKVEHNDRLGDSCPSAK